MGVFHVFLKLYKWYQMAQRMTYEEKTKNSWALIYHFTLIVPQSLISYLEELKIK